MLLGVATLNYFADSITSMIPSSTTLPCVDCRDTIVSLGRGSNRSNPAFSIPSARLSDSRAKSICDKALRVYHGLEVFRVGCLEDDIIFWRLTTEKGGNVCVRCEVFVLWYLKSDEE
jgi:hypothetical protein